MFKYFKSRGFTDRLYIINLIFVILLTIASYLLTIYATKLEIFDTSLFSTALMAAWAELSIHTGFIISKAKKENSQKIANSMIKELAETYGLDSVATVIQTVLED